MGLIIRPKSKLAALQCRLYTWENLKSAYRNEPIPIDWTNISRVHIPKQPEKDYFLVYYSANGYDTVIGFKAEEANDPEALQKFALENPDKVIKNRFWHEDHFFSRLKLHFKYGAYCEKFILGMFAIAFMFYQFKYFGSLMIQKYQFLIKASCNVRCAEMLWSTSLWWFYGVVFIIASLIPVFFFKRIYNSVARSKNIQVINGSMLAIVCFTFICIVLVANPPTIIAATTKYSKIIAAYADGTLDSKLSQKIEMASQREFQGDIDDLEEVQIPEAYREE